MPVPSTRTARPAPDLSHVSSVLIALKSAMWGRDASEQIAVPAVDVSRAIQLLEAAIGQGLPLERRRRARD